MNILNVDILKMLQLFFTFVRNLHHPNTYRLMLFFSSHTPQLHSAAAFPTFKIFPSPKIPQVSKEKSLQPNILQIYSKTNVYFENHFGKKKYWPDHYILRHY